MGYLDKILNKRNQQKKISGDKKKEIYIDKQGREIFNNSFNSREKGYTITIFGIEEQGLKAKHRNGQITKLMLAKAIKVRDEDALIVDLADDIAFELKEGQQPDGNVLQAVAYEYEKRNSLENKICDYLGIVDYTDKGYEITQKSQKVEQYVNQNVIPKILEQRKAREELLAENYAKRQEQEKERERKFLEDLDARGYVAQMQETMKKRRENPYLRKVGQYKINGKTYEDYDGINIQTGDILRIRRLDKVGKDGSGTYLYQGYVHSTLNEDDAEILDEGIPMGISVCFDLPKRFSDIEIVNNPEEIRTILELLSNAEKYSNREGLSYIGGIDRNGKLNHSAEPDSLGIANAIKRLTQEYAKNNGKTR